MLYLFSINNYASKYNLEKVLERIWLNYTYQTYQLFEEVLNLGTGESDV